VVIERKIRSVEARVVRILGPEFVVAGRIRMKKLIGIVAFVAIGLSGHTYQTPSAQADNGAISSEMTDSQLAAQPLGDHGCPPSTPFCCEVEEDGSCYACAGGGVNCP
jgi:hypothetical protein